MRSSADYHLGGGPSTPPKEFSNRPIGFKPTESHRKRRAARGLCDYVAPVAGAAKIPVAEASLDQQFPGFSLINDGFYSPAEAIAKETTPDPAIYKDILDRFTYHNEGGSDCDEVMVCGPSISGKFRRSDYEHPFVSGPIITETVDLTGEDATIDATDTINNNSTRGTKRRHDDEEPSSQSGDTESAPKLNKISNAVGGADTGIESDNSGTTPVEQSAANGQIEGPMVLRLYTENGALGSSESVVGGNIVWHKTPNVGYVTKLLLSIIY